MCKFEKQKALFLYRLQIQFYDENEFVKFNMFNNHFFYGKDNFLKFIEKAKNLFVLIDPPYGGFVKLVANSLNCIKNGYIHILFYNNYFLDNLFN